MSAHCRRIGRREVRRHACTGAHAQGHDIPVFMTRSSLRALRPLDELVRPEWVENASCPLCRRTGHAIQTPGRCGERGLAQVQHDPEQEGR